QVDDGADDRMPELPDKHRENAPSAEAAEKALVRKPQIGDTRPAPDVPTGDGDTANTSGQPAAGTKRKRRRGGRGRGGSGGGSSAAAAEQTSEETGAEGRSQRGREGRGGRDGGRDGSRQG